MIFQFDTSSLESFAKGLTDAAKAIESDMEGILKAAGERVADAMVDAINAGQEIGGGDLKPNTRGWTRRKAAAKGITRDQYPRGREGTEAYGQACAAATKPLVHTGALANRSNWQVKLRRAKVGTITVAISPGSDRARVFYSYLPSKGYNRSQGMTDEEAQRFIKESDSQLGETMARFVK